MANPPVISASKDHSPFRVLGRTRLIVLLVLLAVLGLCTAFFWTTRDAMALLQFRRAQNGSGGAPVVQRPLVDLRPWLTVQALASLAVTAEEKEFVVEAEHLADHEVDQAFAAALRQANLRAEGMTLTGEALALSQKIAQLKQVIQVDQAYVDSLTPKPGAAPGKAAASSDSTNDDLEVAKAQLGLDTDELADAQRDLDRASGDNSTQIREELAAHETTMRQYDANPNAVGQAAALSAKQHTTLAQRIASWSSQSDRNTLILQAQQQARDCVAAFTIERNAIAAKVNAAAPSKDAAGRAEWLADIKNRSMERQILSIYDDRIQTEQQLAAVYAAWSSQVLLQHRILLHLILQSVLLIVAIAIAMVLADALVRRLMAHPALDRRQAHTLRGILEVSVQVVGVLSILLIVFGVPRQISTILGLVTAALTIALQDFILAFFGWFVLVGKNGIHVGDRVEIDGISGEVAEVGLFSTTMLETGEDSGSGHLTGRRITLINSYAIRGKYFNYSTTGQWMWDEITVTIPADKDMHAMAERIHKAVLEETAGSAQAAKDELERGARGEILRRLNTTSVMSLRPSSTGVEVDVRFLSRASQRAEERNKLYKHLIDLLHA